MTPAVVVSIGRHPHSEVFFDKTLELRDGVPLVVHEGGHAAQTDQMIHQLAYDACELPLVNYIAAKELGLAATAIAVFPTRRFVQWMIEVPEGSEIREPKDLEGKRIVSNYFGNTDSVWTRGVLADDYGVDLSGVTWVTVRQERVHGSRMPDDIELVAGALPNQLLATGAVDAKFGNGYGGPVPHARTLWADPEDAAEKWFALSQCFPTLHTIIVRDAALKEHEHLACQLYDTFDAAKQAALLNTDFGRRLSAEERTEALENGFAGASFAGSDRSYLGEDPIPYGMEQNRHVLERLIRYAADQGAIETVHPIEELFAVVN